MRNHAKSAATGVLLVVAFFISGALASEALAQTRSGKQAARPAPPAKATKISEREWGILSGVLGREEWRTAARMTADFIERLEGENAEKQLAQLRYLHIFSLAGRTSSFLSGKNEPAAADSWLDLEAAVRRFKGTELVAPARRFEMNCAGKVNFVCPVRGDRKALRVTATTKDADSILLFEYFVFKEELNLSVLDDRKIFLSGTLERAEYNEDPSKPWIIRLFFKDSVAAFSTGR